MISLKVLGTAAVMVMILPILTPTASFAENPHVGKGVARGAVGGGGAAPNVRFGGGVPRAFNGGAGFRPGGGAPVAQQFGTNGGNWRGSTGREGWRDDHRRGREGGGFIPGAIAGVVIGGALASQSYGYYAPGSYDDQYYDDGAAATAPAPGSDDAVAYCLQNYSSYDPASGTYLGNDGYRHSCP